MTVAVRGRGRNRPVTGLRRIVTPEGLGLPLTLAGRGARLGALMLDLVMQGIVAIVAIVALHLAGGFAQLVGNKAQHGSALNGMQFVEILFLIGGFLLHNGWFLYFELGPRGATPGKRMLGIRVAARGGGALTPEMIIARNLLRDIELFIPLAYIAKALFMSFGGEGNDVAGWVAAAWFALFAFFPFFNRDRLRAGDLIAGTWVVETRKQSLLRAMSVPVRDPEEAIDYRFGEAELAVYGELELQTLERVLRDNRADTLVQVAEAICTRIGWTAPGSAGARPFLQAFYTQLRGRLESGMRFGKRKADKFAG